MSKNERLFSFLKLVRIKFTADKIRAHSAEAAFFIKMSFFPILLLMLTMVRYTPIREAEVLRVVEETIPTTMYHETFEKILHDLFRSSGLVPWTIVVAIWTAGKGVLGITDGLNTIWRKDETRNYFSVRIRAAFYTLALVLSLMLSLGLLVFWYTILDFLLKKIPVLRNYMDLLLTLPTFAAFILLVILFTLMYKFLPNEKLTLRSQIPGALFTALSWTVFSKVFSIYIDIAVNMSVLYGSLATLIVAMLWLYACMFLFLIGCEINHFLKRPELFLQG